MLIKSSHRCGIAFKLAVLRKCYDALSATGLFRLRKGDKDWPLEEGFHCWAGLEAILKKDHLAINPLVGVHVVPIMRFCVALECRRYSRTVSTYAVPMGDLDSCGSIFRFTLHSDVNAVVARLIRLYMSVGMVYAKSIASYESLLPLLQSRVGLLAQYPERTAACLYLMGRKDQARSFTETFLALHRGYFEGFAVPFRELLDRGPVDEVTRTGVRAAHTPLPSPYGRDRSAITSDDMGLRYGDKARHVSFHSSGHR